MLAMAWRRSISLLVRKISRFTGVTQFLSADGILMIVAIILEVASCSTIFIATYLCAGQCLLFATIFERPRILEGAHKGWCVSPAFMHTMAIGSSLFLLLTILRRGKVGARGSYNKALSLLASSTILTFLATMIISSGFQHLCDSFVINRCSHQHFHAMDWRKFTPKYCDCSSGYILLVAAKVCSWCSCALYCALCVIHTVRLRARIPTT